MLLLTFESIVIPLGFLIVIVLYNRKKLTKVNLVSTPEQQPYLSYAIEHSGQNGRQFPTIMNFFD